MSTIKIKAFGNKYELDLIKHTSKDIEAKTGNFLYKGKIKHGKANGPGTLFCDGKKYLEGTWKDGFIQNGKFYEKDEVKYDGTFKNGLYHGKGCSIFKDVVLKCEFKKGKANGLGEIFYDDEPNKPVIKGRWKDDKFVYGKEFGYPGGKARLIYEGHANGFKDGWVIKHGKGTEYDEDGDYFVGTFQNGTKIGKGKKYNKNGSLQKEGTYKNNLLEGIGKEYREDGKLFFKGKYVRGRKTGKGEEYYPNEKLMFKGNFLRGRKHGKGKSFYPNGNVEFDGIFDCAKIKGTKYSDDGSYKDTGLFYFRKRDGYHKITIDGTLYDKGDWDNDRRVGLHYIYHPNGKLKFKGTYEHHDKTGKGKEYWDNGKLKYDGMFKYDRYNGEGKKYNQNGKLVESGTFYSGRLEKGTKYLEDGEYIKGEWNYLGKNGKCTEYWANKKKKREGVWKDNKMNGPFLIYYKNGKLELKATFKDDKRHGKGTEYNLDGSIKRTGYWKDGVYIGKESLQKHKQKEKKKFVQENNIKKYMQTKNKDLLKKVSADSMKEYLMKYAKKSVLPKTKASLTKKLEEWRKELKQQKKKQHNVPVVFDCYEGEDVPVTEFLKDDNRVVLISEKNDYWGVYLEQCEVVYECKSGYGYYDYIGSPNVNGMIQFLTSAGAKYYFDKQIQKDLDDGYNVFHYKTDPKDLKVLSKRVAAGASIVSGLHCDPKDLIKKSEVTKKQKEGKGLTKTVTFEF